LGPGEELKALLPEGSGFHYLFTSCREEVFSETQRLGEQKRGPEK
jgi:hypothetical protein